MRGSGVWGRQVVTCLDHLLKMSELREVFYNEGIWGVGTPSGDMPGSPIVSSEV
jgi:hypothetical protein